MHSYALLCVVTCANIIIFNHYFIRSIFHKNKTLLNITIGCIESKGIIGIKFNQVNSTITYDIIEAHCYIARQAW